MTSSKALRKEAPSASPPKPDEHRYENTPQARCELLLDALANHHERIFPGKSYEDFSVFAYKGFEGKLGPARGDRFIRAVLSVGQTAQPPMPSDPATRAKWIALLVATAYCIEVINVAQNQGPYFDQQECEDENRRQFETMQEAWDYAFDAAQWEGMLCGMLDTPADAARAMGDRGRNVLHEENRRNKAAVYKWAEAHRHEYPATRQLNAMALQIVSEQLTDAPLKTVRSYLTDWNKGVPLAPNS